MVMNRNVMIAVAIVAVLLLAGAAYFFAKSNVKAPSAMVPSNSTPTQETSAFSSIKDALMKSLSLQCNYTDSTTGTKTVAYVKNGMVRADITGSTETQTGNVIMKDNKMYYWNKTSAFMMAMPSITPGAQSTNQGANVMNSLEQYKQYCHTGAVDDSVFNLPTGVKFQDMSTVNSGAGKVPSSQQAQVQEILKKYNNPTGTPSQVTP